MCPIGAITPSAHSIVPARTANRVILIAPSPCHCRLTFPPRCPALRRRSAPRFSPPVAWLAPLGARLAIREQHPRRVPDVAIRIARRHALEQRGHARVVCAMLVQQLEYL